MRRILPRKSAGFTLVELLVVIGIVVLLIGILLASITRVRQYVQKVKCASQLRQIGSAVQMYATAFGGVLNYSKYGTLWLTTSGTTGLIDNQASRAYWGVAYAPFLIPSTTLRLTGAASAGILTAAAGIWHCPSSTTNDPSFGASADDPVSYGINGIITGTVTPRWRRLSRYRNAAELVFAQDAIKSQMSTTSFDTLSNFGSGLNLKDWRPGGAGSLSIGNNAGLREYYRHRGQSNVLWMDGHVTSLAQSDGSDVPGVWYRPPN